MAIIHGSKANGRSGVLDYDELKALIHGKTGGRAEEKNCGTCANHILSHGGTDEGGGITTTFGGRSVFHISSGKKGGSDGCSVFYTLNASAIGKAGTKDRRDVLVAGIVAVGWHARGSDHVYDLDWGKGPPFFTGNKLDTSKQQQTGYKRDR